MKTLRQWGAIAAAIIIALIVVPAPVPPQQCEGKVWLSALPTILNYGQGFCVK